MARVKDWERRLGAYLAACARRPYQWGQHDCALFAAGAVEAMTGADHGAPFRGRYRTARGAIRALRAQGFADYEAPFTAALGDPVAPLLCQRGDIVSNGESIGVLWQQGGPVALFVGFNGEREGLITAPVAELVRGWRV